jgi:hypothetical protein
MNGFVVEHLHAVRRLKRNVDESLRAGIGTMDGHAGAVSKLIENAVGNLHGHLVAKAHLR